MTTAQQQAELDRRRAVLATLYLAPSMTLPINDLRGQIDLIGYTASIDKLRFDCDVMADMGLVEWEDERLLMLTDRGREVVLGQLEISGVKGLLPSEIKEAKKMRRR